MAVEAAHGLLDFLYCARQPQLDKDNLTCLNKDLKNFHNTREIFQTWRAYKGPDFNNFAKMHMLGHYTHQIQQWGVPNGYSTEGPERLHIKYVKIPYLGTSGVDPEAQMTLKLQRIEALVIQWAELEQAGVIEACKRCYQPDKEPIQINACQRAAKSDEESSDKPADSDKEQILADCTATQHHTNRLNEEGPGHIVQPTICIKEQHIYQPNPKILIAQQPTISSLPAANIICNHGASRFIKALQSYLEVQDRNLAFCYNLLEYTIRIA
ncbi:hypothetical protein RhiTH_009603 [Rhizoctonia solani]